MCVCVCKYLYVCLYTIFIVYVYTIFLENLGLVLPTTVLLWVPKAEHGKGMLPGLRLMEGKWDIASTPKCKK